MTQNRDLFDGAQASTDADVDMPTTAAEEQRRREKHLQQVDSTKKLFIDQILRRNCLFDEPDIFNEIIEANLRGESLESQTLQ